ncbi:TRANSCRIPTION INITIATION FACTOR IIA [Encephalitozoon cuniculi GB-M1]|uniref:Transcription initiation factor IIA subunit 2 n=2 Tax=Encephalitozoon cuniculi TaxID=6035 RepID=Q8SSH6_ENCCU|nr:transcription initiation factor IIA subunit gamma [Encephalitozoon cuniculi GB-M1]AGE95631.1 transcription initiation factor IIa [Encephalitozoon cuniculi]KMV66565.1 transcription initiation factor IIA subunitgamma [Encephalitozoon cuniculi EcunIII-L]UYI28235.1 transcription initiation factor IIA subunit gamma [Encephalitozoon cuniculi]CAD25076.1 TRANSCRIPTION INITIATION FACTOR IIA [Encephalitozoon cuniculi GB-M1]
MYEFYRQLMVGKVLEKIVDEKVNANVLSPNQGKHILETFDLSVPIVFNKSVTNSMSFKGKVDFYNHVDGVWRFQTTGFVMSLNNEYFNAGEVNIVACDADINMDAGRRRRKRG